MPLTQSNGNRFRNRVLAALPKSELDRMAGQLKPVTLKQHDTLYQPGEESDYVYFLEEGIASVVTQLKGGVTVEVGIVGREGMVGVPLLIGTGSLPFHSFIQVAGHGYRVKAELMAQMFQRSSVFRDKILSLLHAQFVQTAQTAACNRRHEVAERLARWLLSCRDRGDTDDVNLTQEFLGQMLGAPRTTVTLAATQLQDAELIHYSRGHVKILNHKRLEKASCECYCLVRDEFKRLGLL